MRKRKRVIEFLEGLNTIEGYKLHIILISQVISNYDREMKKYINGIILPKGINLTVKENLTNKEVIRELITCDLFVQTSVKEPAAVSNIEALVNGCIVICSNKSGTSGYGEDGVNQILFDEYNPSTIYTSLEKGIEILNKTTKSQRVKSYEKRITGIYKKYNKIRIHLADSFF